MGSTKHESEYLTSPYPAASRMAIRAKPKQMVIRLRHLDEEGAVLSEAHLNPEDAYAYANAILAAYDEVLGI
jgi:hypothetical protein